MKKPHSYLPTAFSLILLVSILLLSSGCGTRPIDPAMRMHIVGDWKATSGPIMLSIRVDGAFTLSNVPGRGILRGQAQRGAGRLSLRYNTGEDLCESIGLYNFTSDEDGNLRLTLVRDPCLGRSTIMARLWQRATPLAPLPDSARN